MSDGECIVMSTCPSGEVAKELATRMIDQRLAACVNVLPQVLSCYRWKGQVETQAEHLLLIKTFSARFDEVVSCIRSVVPYETPEILILPILSGSPDYLAWMADTMKDPVGGDS